jgi:hypothetical protein
MGYTKSYTKKIIVNIDDKDNEFLLSKKTEGFSMSFIIRKALQLYREQKAKAR